MFKDMAVWGIGSGPDPQVAYIRNGNHQTSGGVGNAWTRPYVSFVPDRDAKYLSVGARVLAPNQASVGSEHLQSQYFTNWQLERAGDYFSYLGASTYSPAREVQVFVKPDRLNVITNPSFTVNTAGWLATATGSLTRVAEGSDFVGNFVQNSAGATNVNAGPFTVAPGESWTGGIDLKMQGQSVDYRVSLTWATSGGSALGSRSVDVTASSLSLTEYRRVVVQGEAPANAGQVRLRVEPLNALSVGNGFRIDKALLEKTTIVGDYFDGSSGDDYLWETGKTPNVDALSFFYENRLDRGEAIRRALRDVVPLGIGVADPVFGTYVG